MTLVVVALDTFTMRVETDDPLVPEWLLKCAEQVQEEALDSWTINVDQMVFGWSRPQ